MITPDFKLIVEKDLYLKLPLVEEAEVLFQLTQKNREHLRRFLGWLDQSTTIEDTKNFIENDRKLSLNQKALTLTIWYQNKPVGCISLHEIDPQNRSTSMGYWLDSSYQGLGIMTKSAKVLIDFAFSSLKIHRIEIRSAVHNERSCKVAERLGFQKEGILKDAIWHYGTYFDAILYGKIEG